MIGISFLGLDAGNPEIAIATTMIQSRKDRSEKSPDSQGSDSPFREPVVLPIEDSIDLHAFSPKEIPSVVEEYIQECVRAGIYEVRIIHGKGTGALRRTVHAALERMPEVASFELAGGDAGGWGATVVALQPRDA